MKAAILQELNQPLVVDDIELNSNLDCGQVLVRVLASTICGAQIGEITGAKGPDKYLPHLLGHEGCGEILDIGPGVTRVKKGDRVVMHWRKGQGIEAVFPAYHRGHQRIGGGCVTTFNEQAVVSENRLTPIEKDIPPAVASLMGCAVTTALGLINNEARLKIGQSIAVAGVGGVGLNIVQGAALVGGNPIFAIDNVESKLGLARVMGATHTIKSSEMAFSWIPKNGVDVFVDCTGDVNIIESGLRATSAGGKLILVGQPPITHTLVFDNFRRYFYNGKIVLSSQGGETDPNVDIPRYLELYRLGKLQLDHLVTHSFPLSEINQAIAVVRSGQAGRVALEMGNA